MTHILLLENTLGTSFNDRSLIEQALIHSSFLNENPVPAKHSNERMEFLGDAVLGIVIAEELYRREPEASEGELTRLRGSIVCGTTLAGVAESIDLGKYLYMGKGEEANGGRNRPANLAGAMESVIGAIFIDQGYQAAKDCTLNLFQSEIEKALEHKTAINYKSRLQEYLQSRESRSPTYHIINASGPDHKPSFTVEVRIGSNTLGTGTGKSKKLAEMEAARFALYRLINSSTSSQDMNRQ
ncbi:MAG: ribonuclease III [Dehalococcoidales bacterium]